MSGSGGAGGYEYQANAFAYVAVHVVCKQRLNWFDDFDDTPTAVSSETSGPGDDLGIETLGGLKIEVQVKRGLSRGVKFDEAVRRIFVGLVKDQMLRGVLLVDTKASEPIRVDFRSDVLRLAGGRTDGIENSTNEVLQLISDCVGTDIAIFRRFRVVVADLGDGESDRTVATGLLRGVIEEPEATNTAWDVLGKDGFRQMSHRGRRDADALIQFLGTRFPLCRRTANLSVSSEAYRLWRAESSKQFFVPGVGVNLQIDRAWIGLRLMERDRDTIREDSSITKRVQAYHEWERLAEHYSYIHRVEAEHLLAFDNHIVVLGGPGAGKSTLADRIAWRYSSENRRVVKVRLKKIAAAILEGKTFDRALIATAADSSGLSFEVACELLASPDILIADGLDETDPNRASVAQSIIAWCASHPSCRVCVLTRPVGHEPGLLPGFRHVELLPLDQDAIIEHSRRLFESLVDPKECTRFWKSFVSIAIDSRATHRVATLAARNPLLLGFLIRLHADGVPLDTNRAGLYQQIIHVIHASKVVGRETDSDLEEAVANRVLDILGWLVTGTPEMSRSNATREVAIHLERELEIPQLRATQVAERGLRHWEDRRLIERLTGGSHEAFVFLHPSLGEFAAARYGAALPEPSLSAWIKLVRTEPKWRQPLLLAAGLGQAVTIVSQLIALDRPNDPTSTEAVLAAAALTESKVQDHDLSAEVLDRLSSRLTSSVPVVAIEAATALRPMMDFASTAIGSLAAKLVDHHQPWTRLAATALAIAAGPKFITLARVKMFLTDLKPTPSFVFGIKDPSKYTMPSEAADLEYDAITTGLGMLFQESGLEEAARVAENLATSSSHSLRIVEIAEKCLKANKQLEVLDRIHAWWARNSNTVVQSIIRGQSAVVLQMRPFSKPLFSLQMSNVT
jgi:hypothetical protein